jgi:PIN like domain
LKVIFDNNLSPRLYRALQELFKGEHIVQCVRDKFNPSIKDVDLIESLNKEGTWVFISGDRRITKIKAERDAFRNSKLIGFFLSPGLYKAPEIKKAERLLALWAAIETTVKTVQPGAMFELPMKSNRVKQLKY